MSVAQRGVGRFCSVVTADLASLALLDAADLGIGAQAFVLSNQKSYRLSALVLATASPVAIAAAGGASTWLQENAVNNQTYCINSLAAASATVTLNTWHALPQGIGRYGEIAAKAYWAVDTVTGIVTYAGPAASFQVTGVLFFSDATDGDVWQMDLTRNGTAIGTTGIFSTSSQAVSAGGVYINSASIVNAGAFGQTYQHILRNNTATRSAGLVKYQAIFQLLT